MEKEKYLQIFNYLKELSKVRSRPILDIEFSKTQYPEILWLDEIPISKLFENIIREDFNNENDFWLKVKKPKEPLKPKFTKLLGDLDKWIEPESLLNEDEEPYLKKTIEAFGESLNLEDNVYVIKELEKYINNKWLDDLFKYNDKLNEYNSLFKHYESLNRTYIKLFSIYNKTQKFGEEYELIIGAGLLNYKENNDSPKIFRHIFTQRVDINFEFTQKDSQILITPNIESYPKIETDSIIGLDSLFDSQNIIDAEKNVENYFIEKEFDTLFKDNVIDDALQMFIETISASGRYSKSVGKPTTESNKPIIQFSPAITLRKRNTRSFTALYENIIENISEIENINIPILNELIFSNENDSRSLSDTNNNRINNFNDNTIYFPKESNDEQFEIVEKANRSDKVLVQGPPGTGKSHTIANLICHLLANGKKVLVTAYTKRALEVLKDKLPQEFQDLTVNLLSSDSSSIQDLQSSVNSINEELSRADLSIYTKQIEQFEKSLYDVRKEIAKNKNDLVLLKEKATKNLEINSKYQGTLTSISESLELDTEIFKWFEDDFSVSLNNETLINLRQYIEQFSKHKKVDIAEFSYKIPKKEFLPDSDQIKSYINILERINRFSDKDINISTSNINILKGQLKELNILYSQYDSLKLKFKDKLLQSYFNGKDYDWNYKIEKAIQLIRRIELNDLKHLDRNVEVTYNNKKSFKQLKSDASILLDFLYEGNSLSDVFFNLKKYIFPTEIKEKLYFIKDVRVNGSHCNTSFKLNTAIKDIELQQDFEEISNIWEIESSNSKNYSDKLIFYKNLNSNITKALEIINNSEVLRLKIIENSNLEIKSFDKFKVQSLIKGVKHKRLINKKNEFDDLSKVAENHLNSENLHPIRTNILNHLNKLDSLKYQEDLNKLQKIKNDANAFKEYKSLESQLKKYIPKLIESIQKGHFDNDNLSNFKDAVFFKQAKSEISKFMDINSEEVLFNSLGKYELKEKNLIAKVASKKAWYSVVENLHENRELKKHLNAWVLAVKKIGKTGRGKRAMKFKKIAQREMEYCKDSIPCWVMPLYKVAETITPEQGMYDYVIIDEASQLGPDAIFLLYITKNIIIVGDDKQTSPEYVGVDANTMTPHIKRHLKNIPFSDYYGTEFSFFDHAGLFCDKPIVLREHFRCMPEIIEFSNKHFYAPEGKGLYPLKQYSENRLKPLNTFFCKEGYTEGKYARIINKPEAEEIVNKISELIENTKYKNKTFGVITLQGGAQANIIENILLKKIGEQEYHNRKIVCGNSASFQGDERDIIFLSLVTAHNHKRAALSKSEDERRFNVAVSRAIEQLWLFHSVHIEDLKPNDLRYKLLDHVKNYNTPHFIEKKLIEVPKNKNSFIHPEPYDSWFEVEVRNDIISKGFSVIPQYEVAKGKYKIDMVAIFNDGTKIAIECDGDKWHGAEKYKDDLYRQKVLERCGWQFFRVRGSEYYSNRKKALEPLWGIFDKIKGKEIELISVDSVEKKDTFIDTIDTIDANNSNLSSKTNRIIENNNEYHDNVVDNQHGIKEDKESHINLNNNILAYYNLFETGSYIISKEPVDSYYSLEINESNKDGFLLQCYKSGHVNKVLVSKLLSKKIDKNYKNGINKNDEISTIEIVNDDMIIGLLFEENGVKKFKAHLTENISNRTLLHLQGYKVIYSEFNNIQYYLYPLEIINNIKRLIFNSFTSHGKQIDNSYYHKEWSFLDRFYPFRNEIEDINFKIESSISASSIPKQQSLFDEKIKLDSIARILFSSNNIELKIRLVDHNTRINKSNNGIQDINIKSPLGLSINGKIVGEIVEIGNTGNNVEVLEILNN